jgi:hypothetical protein
MIPSIPGEISTLNLPNTKHKSRTSVGRSGKLLLALASTVVLGSGSIQIIHWIGTHCVSGDSPSFLYASPQFIAPLASLFQYCTQLLESAFEYRTFVSLCSHLSRLLA